MTDELRQLVIEKLKKGESLPAKWATELFPPEKREYELTYYGKEREEDIIANTMSIPLQRASTFENNLECDWHNMVVFGDNLQILKTLIEQKNEGLLNNSDGSSGVRLVYIDPPFATKKDFKGTADQKAYRDKIAGADFLEFLRKRLVLLRELLTVDGSIYIHLDHRRVHYVKCLCDEVFSENSFRNHIAWCYSGGGVPKTEYPRKHDTLLWYTKSQSWIFNTEYREYSDGTVQRGRTKVKGANAKLRDEGTPINDWWSDVKKITSPTDPEKVFYPTQKSEDLLRRIINISSNKGDIVLDAFAGSGTTLAAAEKLQRRWIGIDCGKFSIYTIQKRLLNLKSDIGNTGNKLTPQPFTIFNAGLYDFSKLKQLPWKDWRFFALQLFGCKDEPHEINGLKLDGRFRGSSVLVFNHLKELGERVDEGTIENLSDILGQRIGERFFIIAPRNVFDFQQDYLDFGNTRYYALRIPYSIINELHQRDFSAIRQPVDKLDVNATVDAVGFDFIQPPQVEWNVGIQKNKKATLNKGFIQINSFQSRARLRGADQLGGLETFSMLMLDFNYTNSVFDFDMAFYADELKDAGWIADFPLKELGENLMVIFIDIFGNEAREVITVEQIQKNKEPHFKFLKGDSN